MVVALHHDEAEINELALTAIASPVKQRGPRHKEKARASISLRERNYPPPQVPSGSFKPCPSRANLASLSLVIERDAELRKSQDDAGVEMLG
jgi:hypothetical protein